MPGTGSVCIVVPSYNGWRDTIDCVESLSGLDYADRRVVVVENGSTDDSFEQLTERLAGREGVELVRETPNRGCAAGLNAGLRAAAAHHPDFVWLLNNDTILDPHALTALVDAAHDFPHAGTFASKIYYFARPDVIWSAGGTITPLQAKHRGGDEKDEGQYDTPETVEWATGCSLLARWEVVERIGEWSEDYYLYWEDVDWVVRARNAGFECLYVPTSIVWHKVAGSTPLGKAEALWRYEGRNRVLFYRRNRPSRTALVTFFSVLNAGYLLLRGRPRSAGYLLQGLWDAFRGRTGAIGG